MPMNLTQVRVVDPVLTTISIGYRNASLVGDTLFPRVTVPLRAGRIIEFDKTAFRLVNTARAPGAVVQEITIGYEGKPFALVQHRLEGKVPTEHLQEASRGPGVDMGSRAVATVLDVILLGAEHEQATLARDPTQYSASHVITLTGTDKWSDAGSNPMDVIDGGRETVRASIGRYPNTLLLGPSAFNAAKKHPKIEEKLKYTTSASITAEMLAAQWNLKRVVVGEAIYMDEDGTSHDVWGNDAILAYIPENGAGKETPAYGYTYVLTGNPLVESAYLERNVDSWLYPVTYERKPVIVGPDGGVLIRGVA